MTLNAKLATKRADFIKYFKKTYGLFLDFHKYQNYLLITLRTKRNDVVQHIDIARKGDVKFFAPADLDISDELADDLRSSFGGDGGLCR